MSRCSRLTCIGTFSAALRYPAHLCRLDTKCRWGVRPVFQRDPESRIYLVLLDGIDVNGIKSKRLEVVAELVESGVMTDGVDTTS